MHSFFCLAVEGSDKLWSINFHIYEYKSPKFSFEKDSLKMRFLAQKKIPTLSHMVSISILWEGTSRINCLKENARIFVMFYNNA